MDITFCGTMFDCTGYGVASRGYALALHRLGHNLRVVDYDAVPAHRHHFAGYETLRALQHHAVPPDIYFTCSHPIYSHGFRRRVISLTFEGPRIPYPTWIADLNRFDLVVVPCRRNAEILQAGGLKTKLVVEGYGVDPAPALPKPDLAKAPFTFVSVFSWVPRKNIGAMVQAYASAFPPDGRTRLLLKTFILRGTPQEYQQIQQQIDQWSGGHRDDIIIVDHPYPEIHTLFNQCHAYLCTSLDEGFYLPAAESLMCGLPVITVGFGGQMEFCSDTNSYLVDYEPIDGYAWVKVEELARTMRHVYEHYDEATAKAMAGRTLIAEKCNWDRITERILSQIP